MTSNEILKICKREMLFGATFLEDYESELYELLSNQRFIQVVKAISDSVPVELEFSTEQYSPKFISFKKEKVSDTFFRENLKNQLPAYQSIYDSVVKRNKTGLSATISIYYATRYYMIKGTSVQASEESAEDKDGSKANGNSIMISDFDFRQKWPASYRCEDGHYVRSKNEQLVDNWLYSHNVCHAYEPLAVDKRNGREYVSDFYIPELKLYVEVWGFETVDYMKRKAKKIETYGANNYRLLELTDNEIKILDDYMRRTILAKL